jgi:hypothetical protein
MNNVYKIKPKVKVCRASGLPVQIENLNNFQNEMRAAYDKILLREGINLDKPLMMEKEQAERMQRLLDRVERILRRKYPNIEYWYNIREPEVWKHLVEKHGPIMIAKDSETGELVYVIYDVQI